MAKSFMRIISTGVEGTITWQDQPRIAIRWNQGGGIGNMPPGIYTSVTLPAELYPAIIENILHPDVQGRTRGFLGPDLANGNYPNAAPQNPNQNYRHPRQVTSPRKLLGPFCVVLNNGPGDGAYMIGIWGTFRGIGFRWNGADTDPRGFPISRDYPVWIMLPDVLRDGFSAPGPFVDILPSGVRDPVIGFLNGKLDLPQECRR